MKRLLVFVAVATFFITEVNAQWKSGRPDGHAPIQIMGDHAHGKGEIMFSYRYMIMDMDGNGDGTDELSNSSLLRPNGGDYMVAPEVMPMQMHMLGAMYAISDDLTIMMMLNYIDNEMDHITAMGNEFTTASSGLGDIKVSGLYTFFRQGNMQMHANIGLSIPTGTLEASDETPMSAPNEAILPYPMQLGSGTFDFMPGVTFLAQNEKMSFGSQLKGVLRLGENDRDYTLGNRLNLNGWAGYKLNNSISPMISFNLHTWGDIDGADVIHNMALNNDVVHTVDPDLKAGTRLDLGFGLNFQGPEGPLRGARFGVNYDLPVYQNLDGPQMMTQGILTFGLQYSL